MFSRRDFFCWISKFLALVSSVIWNGCAFGIPIRRFFSSNAKLDLSSDQWSTIRAVQEHLLPSEPGTPGASDSNALLYFQAVIGRHESEEINLEFFLNGLQKLEKLVEISGYSSFIDIDENQKEAVLRALEGDEKGRQWIIWIYGFICEAFLGAPAYGGNPNEVAWKWLGHNPGFPLPVVGKRYFEL